MKTKGITELLKYFDIYGINVGINFRNHSIHRTECGCIVSLSVIFVFLVVFYSYMMQLAQKQHPIVISTQRFVTSPEKMSIDKQKQTVMMGFINSQGSPIFDPSIIQVSSNLIVTTNTLNPSTNAYVTNTQTINLRIRACTVSDIQVQSLAGYFGLLNLSSLYCFDDNQDIYVQGDSSQATYAKVEVYFKQCINQNGVTGCQSPTNIATALANSQFNAYLIDKVVDPTNYSNPFQYGGLNINAQTSAQSSTQFTTYFSNYYIQSDVGLAQEQIQNQRDFFYAGKDTQQISSDPSIVLKLVLTPQKNKENLLQRRYMKVGDYLAQLMAILKMLIIFGFIVTYPFIKFHLNKEIVNSIYEFDFDKNSRTIDTKENEADGIPLAKIQNNKTHFKKSPSNDQVMSEAQPLAQQTNGNQQKGGQFIQKYSNQLNEKVRRVSFQVSSYENQQKDKSDVYTICNSHQDQESQAALGKQEFINKFFDKNNNESKHSDAKKLSNSQSIKDNSQYASRRFSQYQQEQLSGNNVNTNTVINPKDHRTLVQDIQQAFRLEQSIKNWAREFVKPFKKVLTFNIGEYISQIFFPFSQEMKQKKDLVDESIQYLKQRLDVEYIMHKFQELDKLKQIVLDVDQIKLFDLLPKPVIRQNQSKIKQADVYYFCADRSYEERISDAQVSLFNLLNKHKKSSRDLKILELLDNRIFEIFQPFQMHDQQRRSPQKGSIIKYTQLLKPGNSPPNIFSQINEIEYDQDQDLNNQYKGVLTNTPIVLGRNYTLEQIKQENDKLSLNEDSQALAQVEQEMTFQKNLTLQMIYHKNSYNS